MEREKICIFACGGHGKRMGGVVPKQFMRLGTKTILQLAIEGILSAVGKIRVLVVLPDEHISFWKEECARQNFNIPQGLVKGGITRFHSVKNALEKVPDGTIVAVHDGVRPFVRRETILSLFERAETVPAVIPVIPVTDTLKVLRPDAAGNLVEMVGITADRSVLFGAQTPQVFWSEALKQAYTQPYDISFTDDASVVSKAGTPVCFLPGDRTNIKITTPEDMLLASGLL